MFSNVIFQVMTFLNSVFTPLVGYITVIMNYLTSLWTLLLSFGL